MSTLAVLAVVSSALGVAADLFLWVKARRNLYGKTADGMLYAALIGWAALAFLNDSEVAAWSFGLALGATFALFAMASNRGELR